MIYQIYDARNNRLLEDYPVVEASRPIEAVRKYLAQKGESFFLKISKDNDVQFGVFPCCFENGKIYRLAYKRQTWFQASHF